jgi:NADP-dependent 3-hydroxy acid dehydrogenase YdfG
MSKVIVVIGAGPGIGKSVAEKFGQEGFSVALISRRKEKLEELAEELREKGIDAHAFAGDAGDAESMKDAFGQIWEKWSDVDVIHYNVAKVKRVNIAIETADGLTRDFKTNVAAVMTVLNLVAVDMEKKGDGTILLTGGGLALNPDPDFGSLGIGKAAIRHLAHSLHLSLKPKNIFVGTVTVKGVVDPTDKKYAPSAIAAQFWKLYRERNDFEIQY